MEGRNLPPAVFSWVGMQSFALGLPLSWHPGMVALGGDGRKEPRLTDGKAGWASDGRKLGVAGPSRPRLSRHPCHGAPKRNPSGIPSAMVSDHGASVSTGFPSSDAGRGPAAPAKSAPYPATPSRGTSGERRGSRRLSVLGAALAGETRVHHSAFSIS